MSESKPYFYETEIEWKGKKDLRITSGKLPVIEAGTPPACRHHVYGDFRYDHRYTSGSGVQHAYVNSYAKQVRILRSDRCGCVRCECH